MRIRLQYQLRKSLRLFRYQKCVNTRIANEINDTPWGLSEMDKRLSDTFLKKFPELQNYRLAENSDFIGEILPKDRASVLRGDLNGDHFEDVIMLLVGHDMTEALVVVFAGKNGVFEKISFVSREKSKAPSSLKKTYDIIEYKAAGSPGIAERQYFMNDKSSEKIRARIAELYQKLPAVEVTGGMLDDPYYCTTGYYFYEDKWHDVRACD